MKRRDDWFFQKDIERHFIAFDDWKDDLVPVFEQCDSYVEAFYSCCLPIPVSRLRTTFADPFSDPSWTVDYALSRAKIFRDTSKHFLTRAFRNRAGKLELRSLVHSCYVDPTTERTVARRECRVDQAYRHRRILVSPILLAQFLSQTRQALLWCVSSIRFTERRLDEFGVHSYEECVKRDAGIYVRSANPITAEGKLRLPRMESASRILGKRRVHEIDHYAHYRI
jgi:hypothetical protein